MSFPTTVYLTEEQIIQTTSDQRLPLGTRGCLPDGRIFRYAQAGATALKAFYLCQSAAEGPASTSTITYMLDDYAAGTTRVQLGINDTIASTVTKNYYKDGYLACYSTDISYSQIVPIEGHPALTSGSATSPAAAAQWIDLQRPGLKKAADTSTSLWKLVANPYRAVVVAAIAHSTGYAVGIAPCAVAASYYFWIQTWGPTVALDAEAGAATIDLPPGKPVFWSTGVAGGVSAAIGSTAAGVTDSGWNTVYGKIGDLLTCAPADTFFCMINLKIAP